jgi:hypothetical protein
MRQILGGIGDAYASSAQPEVGVTLPEIAVALGREEEDSELERAIYELTRTGYLEPTLEVDQVRAPLAVRPTEKALQIVAGWPGGADALLAEIATRLNEAPTEEERRRLQRALDSLTGLGREVLSDIIANVITRGAG